MPEDAATPLTAKAAWNKGSNPRNKREIKYFKKEHHPLSYLSLWAFSEADIPVIERL